MSDNLKRTGKCLCGAVKYEVELHELKAHICHCTICQKWAGSSSFSIHCKNWTIDGENNVTWFDSSGDAQRGFCKTCGSHLFFRTLDGNYQGVTAALDDIEGLSIGEHIFIDFKPPYYDFVDDAPRLTEAEFLAQFEEK